MHIFLNQNVNIINKAKYYYYKKYIQNIHDDTIENMKLYIRPYPPKLSFNSKTFNSNSIILVTNS